MPTSPYPSRTSLLMTSRLILTATPSPISPTSALLPLKGGVQTATVHRIEGERAAGTNDGGEVVIEGALVSTDEKHG